MPRIQEYLPEQDAQGAVGQTTPMLEQVTMFGRGIEEFGRDLGDAYSVIHQRQAQVESADASASVAEQREAYMERIQQSTNDGTLDVEKVKQDYQGWAEKQADQYSTTQGKDAFLRASSRTGGAILLHAAKSKAVVMGNQAKENLNNLSISNSNVALKDPTQFPDLYAQQTEAIQSQVETGALTPAQARQASEAMSLELSKSAVRGYMQSDYDKIKGAVVSTGDKIDPNHDNFNQARKMLRSGAFDEFLNSDQKKTLESEILHNQQAAQSAGKQVNDQKLAAYGAQAAAWQASALEKLETNSLDPSEVKKAVEGNNPYLDQTVATRMYHLIDQAGKAQLESDPAQKNRIVQRMLTPENDPSHIADPMQVANMVGNRLMSFRDFKDVQQIAAIKADPVAGFNMGQLMAAAKQKIGTGPAAEYKMSIFTSDMLRAVNNAKAANEPVGNIFDPASNKYFGNQIGKYLNTPQQALAEQANAIRGNAPPPANVQTRPGVVPTTAPTATDRNEEWQMMKSAARSLIPENPFSGDSFSSIHNTSNNDTKKKPDYSSMSVSDINKLDPSKMNADEKAKVRARINDLRKKGGR